MACPPRLTSTNRISAFTLTSSTPADTDIDFLKNEYRARRARFSGANAYTITGDHPATLTSDYFAVIPFGGDSINQYRLQLNLGGGNVYDSGFQTQVQLGYPAGGGFPPVIMFPIPLSTIFDQFVLDITMGGGQVLEIRAILTGFMLQFETGLAYQSQASLLTPPQLVLTSGGSNLPRRGQVESRQFAFDLPKMTDADREALYEFERDIGIAPFIVDGFPERTGIMRTQHQFLGRFDSNLAYEHWADPPDGRHRSSMVVVEA